MFNKPSGCGMSASCPAPPSLMLAAYQGQAVPGHLQMGQALPGHLQYFPTGQVMQMPHPVYQTCFMVPQSSQQQVKQPSHPPRCFPASYETERGSERGGELGGEQGGSLVGRVRRLSRTRDGCLEVQRALEQAEGDEEREAIARELRGHVLEACKCMHANHVVQKCIVASNPQSSQFIIDELLGLGPGLGRVAKHKYGCRILQRLLEHCRPDQLLDLARKLVDDGAGLAMHIYGTYVVQSILEHGPASQRQRLLDMTVQMAPMLGADVHGAAVLSCALALGDSGEKAALARALNAHPDLLVCMARTRRGHIAVLRVAEILGEEGVNLRSRLAAEGEALRACRYGKVVLARLAEA